MNKLFKFEELGGQFPHHELTQDKQGNLVLKPKKKVPVRPGKKQYEYLIKENIELAEAIANSEDKIYIPYNVKSLKNGRIFGYVQGKPVLKYSDDYNIYLALTAPYFAKNTDRFKEMIKDKQLPYRIGFYFIRATKQRWDYINCVEGVQDIMVRQGWIPDDSADILIPVFCGYMIDKYFQGLMIKVL